MKNKLTTLILLFQLGMFAQAGHASKSEDLGGGGSFIKEGEKPIQGFASKIEGNDFQYAFPIPGISKSMIIRGNKNMQNMSFKTSAAETAGNALFVLPVGIGSNAVSMNIDMYINDVKKFRFNTTRNPNWNMANEDGSTLGFENIAFDGNQDMKGFLYFRTPALKKGEALNIRFVAEDTDVKTWFMVYTDQLKQEIKARLLPAMIKDKQQIMVDITHFGVAEPTTIKIDGKEVSKQTLKLGYNYISVDVEKVSKPKKINIEVTTASQTIKKSIELKPSRPWQLNFVQHSHTDIGYTRPQTDILAEHIRYIDYALDYCDLTDNYPDDAKFRWVCEAAWAVEEYIKTRPSTQIERLKKRVKEGRIEITGMLFNFDEIPDENVLVASLKPFVEFKKTGLDCSVAMQNDVNGIGWCFADYFPALGVKYLNMGTHGHRALICFDFPTLFRWQSPSGKEMIAYRAEHYNQGNFLGVEKEDFAEFEKRTLDYLSSLEAKGYPYDLAQAQYSGYFTDNSPPSTQACENIKKWNEKYTSPKLRSAVASEFFKEAEKRYYSKFPIIKGAWPDWWTDGFGAGPREVSATRKAHTDLIAASGGIAMAKILGAKVPENTGSRIDETQRTLLFFDEHTTGYSESVREPYCLQTMEQRAIKESYAWEGYRRAKIIGETSQGLLQQYVPRAKTQSIAVYNTLSWNRSGMTTLYIDHEILPILKKVKVTDEKGNEIKIQPQESRSDGTFWNIWVDNVPAFGSKQLFIEVLDTPAERASKDRNLKEIKISNKWYDIEMDTKKGLVTKLYDKQLSKSIIDSKAKYSLGEFIHEELADRSSLESYRMGAYKRSGLDEVWFDGFTAGAIYDAYKFNGNTKTGIAQKDVPNYYFELRVYHTQKRIELAFMINKRLEVNPESFYIAMPFELDNSKIYFEAQGGVVQAGVDQVPGSANDWNSVQNFTAVRNQNSQIVVVSHETPLMQFGNINTGRYKRGATPESSHIYSWPMNNYWVTNFNADNRGELRWSYIITSTNSALNSEATKFGWGSRIPLMGRVLPKVSNNETPTGKAFGSLLELGADNLLLINMNAVSDGVMLHLRETDGKDTALNIKSDYIKNLKLVTCNAIGEEITESPNLIKGYESKFVKIKW